MDGKKKYIIIGVVLLVVIVILYFVFKKKADAKKSAMAVDSTTASPVASAVTKATAAIKAVTTPASTSVFPLKKGSKGPEVAMLQRYILKEYSKDALPTYGADGQWGSEMEVAAMTYLKKNSVSSGWFKGAGINEY